MNCGWINRVGLTWILVVGVAAVARCYADSGLTYRFQDHSEAYYNVKIVADTPDAVETRAGCIAYQIKSVDSTNGQILLGYSSRLKLTSKPKPGTTNGGPMFPPRFGRPMFTFGARGVPEIMIDNKGNVIRNNRNGDSDQLPYLLGLTWQLILEPLPSADETSWKQDEPVEIYESNSGQGWGPMFARSADDGVSHAAHQTITFTRGAADATTVTVQREITLATEEKVGNSPMESVNGTGQFVFDTAAGLVKSLDMTETVELNTQNVTVRVPITVTARLMTPDEVTQYKAAEAAEQTKLKARNAQAQADFQSHNADEVSELPSGLVKTEMVGGNGGGPYMKVDKDQMPLLGFRIEIGSWDGHDCIGHADPIFERPTDGPANSPNICLARHGYVVGGLILNKSNQVDGMRVIFVKQTPTGVDANDRYLSPWYGIEDEANAVVLAGKGERIVGVFGREGLNADALGLIYVAGQ